MSVSKTNIFRTPPRPRKFRKFQSQIVNPGYESSRSAVRRFEWFADSAGKFLTWHAVTRRSALSPGTSSRARSCGTESFAGTSAARFCYGWRGALRYGRAWDRSLPGVYEERQRHTFGKPLVSAMALVVGCAWRPFRKAGKKHGGSRCTENFEGSQGVRREDLDQCFK